LRRRAGRGLPSAIERVLRIAEHEAIADTDRERGASGRQGMGGM
jgi:hypothetical protein